MQIHAWYVCLLYLRISANIVSITVQCSICSYYCTQEFISNIIIIQQNMSQAGIDYGRLNRILKSNRETLSKKGTQSELPKQTKGMISWVVRQTSQRLSNPLRSNECILFHLQVLALPDEFVGPRKLAILLPETLSQITLSLRFNRPMLLSKPAPFFDYLFLFKRFLTIDRLLCIYHNLPKDQFTKFMAKLKRLIISLIYHAMTFGFKFEELELLQLWAFHWIKFGILKEKEELYNMLRLKIPKDLEQYRAEPPITAKYFTKKKVDSIQEDPKKPTVVRGDVEYTGEKAKIFEDFMKRFKGKKPDKLVSYIDSFYELVLKLSSIKNRRHYFYSEKDYLLALRNRLLTAVSYFIQNFNLLQKYKQYIMLWDILRLIAADIGEPNQKMLKSRVAETCEKINKERYRYNIEVIRRNFDEAIRGSILVEVEDEQTKNWDFTGLNLRDGDEFSMPYSFEEFYEELCRTMKQCEDDKIDKISEEDYVKSLDDLLFAAKVYECPRPEAIKRWFDKVMAKKGYGIDLWKKQRMALYFIYALKYVDDDELNEFKEKLFGKLEELGRQKGAKVVKVSKASLLLNGMSEERLGLDTPLKEIMKFREENEAIVSQSFARINLTAKILYEQKKAKDERYQELNRVIGRLFKALQFINHRLNDALKNNIEFETLHYSFKVYGSAANTFWTNESDIDITLVVEEAFLLAPVTSVFKRLQLNYLEKAAAAIKARKIGNVEVIRSARIPIIKYDDSLTKIKCDINVNNLLGVVNSSLIAAYATYDQRFHILGYFIKEWAKDNNVQGGDKHMLTSYAYLNMLIQYLQIVEPPVLPSLQKLHLSNDQKKEVWIKYPVPEKIISKAEGQDYDEYRYSDNNEHLRGMRMKLVSTNIYFEEHLRKVRNYMQETFGYNFQTIAELLAGFFKFYSFDFDSDNHMISIKEGKVIEKKEPDSYLFSIEDPFDLYHNPGKTLIKGTPHAKEVKMKFFKAYLSCLQGFRMLIDQFGNESQDKSSYCQLIDKKLIKHLQRVHSMLFFTEHRVPALHSCFVVPLNIRFKLSGIVYFSYLAQYSTVCWGYQLSQLRLTLLLNVVEHQLISKFQQIAKGCK
eukprot:TRINITY_DN19_c0_g1_i1.p1 TRINITY_DN19_c0_g1~~TRINITY_DN19_c0_g1_i1.p1  ORF type:complete len:1089 (-),score=90.52 TRINITY_DN19_c0_g1_i1:16664-19930(-)